ncbi:MAG: polysaccharide biosynthesis protein [Solobacterium sp.]|nr:polysaccharide biosynthesis protein [Solobacterium sp.]
MDKSTRVLFISSTGGHLTELLQLSVLFDRCDYRIITEDNPSNLSLKERFGEDRVAFVPYGSKSQPLTYVYHFSANIIRSFRYFLKWKPDVIITTGTHTAVPMCRIAHAFGKKVIWIETFANATTPTMAGKMIYPIADLFIVQWESMLEVYPDAVYGGWIF